MPLARVLLIEDDLFIRSTLSALLVHRGFEVVGQTDSAEEALLLQGLNNPEVILVDLDLGPGPNGIDIATAMRVVNPAIGIVMLTTFKDPRFADIKNLPLPRGTRYLAKGETTDVSIVVTAILQALRNPLYQSRNPRKDSSSLNESQIEILRLVAEGRTTANIAELRGVSEKTIEATLSRIYTSLDLPKNRELNPRIQLTRAFLAMVGRKPPGE